MFIIKNKYFLIIENIKDINLYNIKRSNKFIIIYRNNKINQDLNKLKKFRTTCKSKSIKFFIANNLKLATLLHADGIYLSSHNKTFKHLNLINFKFKTIGSAHNAKEINLKIKQCCNYIFLSKLFLVDYNKSASVLGIIKFNYYRQSIFNKLIPLGGIKYNNLNYLKCVNSDGLALKSEVKKKPAITNRLF
ncbi:thiamine phosphate synthase [Pelagibacteraceae bacterium]|jgi:thiamine-phosphate pyrophosphorylase|nr:thiamine phosphate synthase [Pelagibacteraceae bacterium]MDC1158354.1 thiamine phosphate synthase [Pelagibacteraceae bacterium]